MTVLARIRARLRSEDGFGIVEMVTAALLVAVGLVGALAAFDGAKKTSYTAQRHEQAIAFAEREIERLKTHPFELLELDPPLPAPNTTPDDPNNPRDPLAYVEDTNLDGAGDELLILADYHDRAAGPPPGNPESEPLIVDGDTADDEVSILPVQPDVVIGPTAAELPVGAAETTATVYRFVTGSCELLGLDPSELLPTAPLGLCTEDSGAKRITVAVVLDEVGSGAGPRTPFYVSSVITRDPPEGQP